MIRLMFRRVTPASAPLHPSFSWNVLLVPSLASACVGSGEGP